MVSASGYASASTDAYGLLAGSNPDRFDRLFGGSNEHSTASSRLRWMSNLYISSFSKKAGMDSEKVLRSVPTVFSSPSLLGMIQAFKLADQIMGSHPGEASESVG